MNKVKDHQHFLELLEAYDDAKLTASFHDRSDSATVKKDIESILAAREALYNWATSQS